MKTPTRFLIITVLLTLFSFGCAGPERKLGRGISNTMEFVRLGEVRHSIEHAYLWEGSRKAYTTGLVRGINNTIKRTAVGLYEVVTFPIPSYEPVFGLDDPVYPESYSPGVMEGPTLNTDVAMGFSGGDVAPFIPGSRFRIFEN